MTLSKSLVIFLSILTLVSCSTDDSDNPFGGKPTSKDLFNADPSLNEFIITTWDESIVKVDPKTGKEEIIYTLPDYTYPESYPDYYNGTVYIASDDNSVNALDPINKQFLWDTPMLEYDNALGISNTNCENGVCYTAGGFGVVVALDAISGNLLWYYSTDLSGELDDVLNEATTPLVYNDKVYVFSEADFLGYFPAYMHVLDKETGTLLNKVELPNNISSVPLIENDILYLPAINMYVIDLNTLQVIWSFEADGVTAPQVTHDKVVFHGIPFDNTIYSALYCLDKSSGQVIWAKDTGFDTLWTALVVDNVVFGVYEEAIAIAFATNGRPFALDLDNGDQIWFRDDVSLDHSPVYANGRLYFHGHDINKTGELEKDVGFIAMDASTGEVLWINNVFRRDYASAPLVIAKNGVFGPGYFR